MASLIIFSASNTVGLYRKPNGEVLDVAIKTLHNSNVQTCREAFITEAQLMMKLNHHCIVKLIGLSLGASLLMVQELVPLGSMLNYIIENGDRVSPAYEFKVWATQIACGTVLFILIIH